MTFQIILPCLRPLEAYESAPHTLCTPFKEYLRNIPLKGNFRSPERAEHEIYIGNYPVKFREAEVRKLFRDCGVAVGAIRMKTVGLKV